MKVLAEYLDHALNFERIAAEETARSYSELLVQICSPHEQLYRRRVTPFRGSSIL
jgi:hypothetical protein